MWKKRRLFIIVCVVFFMFLVAVNEATPDIDDSERLHSFNVPVASAVTIDRIVPHEQDDHTLKRRVTSIEQQQQEIVKLVNQNRVKRSRTEDRAHGK